MGMLLTYHPGYRDGDAEAEAGEAEARPVERQNKAQLQETAAGLELSTEGTKAELRERILAHLAETEDPDADSDGTEGDETTAEDTGDGDPEDEPTEDAEAADPEADADTSDQD